MVEDGNPKQVHRPASSSKTMRRHLEVTQNCMMHARGRPDDMTGNSRRRVQKLKFDDRKIGNSRETSLSQEPLQVIAVSRNSVDSTEFEPEIRDERAGKTGSPQQG